MANAKMALKFILLMTLLTGVAYPLLITGVGQLLFPMSANGSLIVVDGKGVGSEFVGQSFSDPRYFWPRPSAISYNPLPSSGSNLGPTSADLKKAVDERRAMLESAHGTNRDVPSDLLCASGSGLDPHISPEAARYQVDRIMENRKLDQASKNQLLALIERMTEEPSFGILGEPRVNVLKLNLALDSLDKAH